MSYPILAPNSTWFTQGGTTVTRASITTIDIKDSYTPAGTVTSSWDASAAKDGSIMCYVEGTKLVIAGNGSGKVMANKDSSNLFADSENKDYFGAVTEILGGSLVDTVNATTFFKAFNNCSSLVVAPDIQIRGTDVRALFQLCTSLTTVDATNWDMSKATSFQNLFIHCYNLKTIDGIADWNTDSVSSLNSAFAFCVSLEEVNLSRWNVSGVTSMNAMFQSTDEYGAMALKSIGDVSNWNTGKVTTMKTMFQNCSSLITLNVSKWSTKSCTDMSFMFNGCTSLEVLDVSNWDVSKVTTMHNMFGMPNYGSVKSQLTELDVSNWNPSSCTDMAFMFYGLNGLTKPLDVSNWDVSKVTTFDHMMAHSYATLVGVENWAPSSVCTNMNAMFHTVQNTSLDVSKFNTSNVKFFSQMFEYMDQLTEIKGLEKFNTANALGFEQMFNGCSSLKKLDLSSFDTRKAKDGVTASTNGHITATMQYMFSSMTKLEEITLGANFTFKGDGTTTNTSHYAVLPTTVDGNWYTRFREPVATIPDYANETYYASLSIVDNIEYFIKNGTMLDLADKIRILSGTEETMTPAEMKTALNTHNTEMSEVLSEQDDLIAQIRAALDGKTAGGGAATIAFTIGDAYDSYNIYQAEEGMTWAEWCNSEYSKTNSLYSYESGSEIYINVYDEDGSYASGGTVCDAKESSVSPSDIIVFGEKYTYIGGE